MNHFHLLAIKSGPNVAGPTELSVIVYAEHECAEQIALAFREAAKNEFRRRGDFPFHPIRRPARFVKTVCTFADDAFEPLLSRRREKIRAVSGEMIGIADELARLDHFLQQTL